MTALQHFLVNTGGIGVRNPYEGRLYPVVSTSKALEEAKMEADPERALALFGQILGQPEYEKKVATRFDEFTGELTAYTVEYSMEHLWQGKLSIDSLLSRWLINGSPPRLAVREKVRVGDIIIEHMPPRTESSWRGDDFYYSAYVQLSRPTILETINVLDRRG